MKYTNVITGKTISLDYEPAGEAWQRKPDDALARRLLRQESARAVPRKTTKEKT